VVFRSFHLNLQGVAGFPVVDAAAIFEMEEKEKSKKLQIFRFPWEKFCGLEVVVGLFSGE
jgi:hypothetical protein